MIAAEAHRFGVLGTLLVDGEPAGSVRPAQRRLLSLLLLDPGASLHRDTLIERLWGAAPPATAINTLQAHVSGLRHHVGTATIEHRDLRYRLVTEPGDVDATTFVDLGHRAGAALSAGDATRASDLADAALGLWRGSPFPLLEDEVFARPHLVRLHETHLAVTETRIAASAARGDLADHAHALEGLVLEHPHRETLWGYLMLARQQAGRRVEALQAYRDAHAALSEVGLEPGQTLRQLHERLLRDAPPPVPLALAAS